MKPPHFRSISPILRIVTLSFLAILGIAVVAGGIFVYRIIASSPSLEAYRSAEEGPVVYDASGEEIGHLREEQQVHVSIDDIPESVIHAVVAIEDRRFFDHRGLDLRGIARAAWRNLRAGRIVQGASTLTQQLARTLYLSRERTMTRKISESYLALQMERRYDKEEILEMYLNEVYFGGGATGIEAASQRFFDKSVEEVNQAEAAMLAGSLRSPLHYNPVANPERARRRLSVVLSAMQTQGFITSEEADELLHKEPDIVPPEDRDDVAADFLGHIRDKLADRFEGDTLYQQELEIHTTLDRSMQEQAEQSIEQGFEDGLLPTVVDEDEPVNEKQPQAALVSIDSRTGAVRAMVGGRGGDSYNRAALTQRQPGSALKPFVYSAAIEERGYHPGTIVNDMPVSSPLSGDRTDTGSILAGLGSPADLTPAAEESEAENGREVWPRNFDNRYRGLVSFREALSRSLNVPAVLAAEDIGVDTTFEHMERFGFSSFTDEDGQDDHYSLALGGLEEGVTPLEMAAAYAPFANQGSTSDPYTVTEIMNEDGDTIYEADIDTRSVISSETAYLLRDMLRSAVEDGTGSRAQLEDVPVAGKTGTTDLNTDGWFVGFSDYVVTSIWAGEDRAVPMLYDRIDDEDGEEVDATHERTDDDEGQTEILGVDVSGIWRDYWDAVRDESADDAHDVSREHELPFGEPVLEPYTAAVGPYSWNNRPGNIREFSINPVTGLPAMLHSEASHSSYAPDFHRKVHRELKRTDQPTDRLSLVPLPLAPDGRFYTSAAAEKAPEAPPFTFRRGDEVETVGDGDRVQTAGGQPFSGTYEETGDNPLQPLAEDYDLPYAAKHPYFVPEVSASGEPELPEAPRLPDSPRMPGAPESPGLPGAPGLPDWLRMPGLPETPGTPETPGPPGAPL